MKGLRIALAIPAGLLLSAIVMRAFDARVPAGLAVDLAQPVPVATNWNAFGAVQLGALFAGTLLGAAAYLRIVRRGAAAAGLRTPIAVAGIASLALLAAWCVPVIFSSDAYAYATYGELARLGGNPYAHLPLPGGSALFDATIVQWGNPPPACVYGLPFVWIAAAIVGAFAPLGVAAQLDGLRILSASALVGSCFLAYAAYSGDWARRLTAAATIALNPATIWCAVEGHNDALAVAVALAGLTLARRGRPGIGAAVAALAGAIKLPGILAAVPPALASRRARLGGALGALAALAFSAPLIANLASGLAPHARYAPQVSLQAFVKTSAAFFLPDPRASIVAWGFAAAAAAACAVFAIPMLRRGCAEGWTYLALGGWVLVPNPYPWYGVWLLAVAAFAPGTRGAAVLLGLSLTALLRYIPDAVATPGPSVSIGLSLLALAPFAALVRWRPGRLL